MKAKSALKKTISFKKVYIENDYCQETRKTDSNLRTLLKEMGKNNQYRVEGGKLLPIKGNNNEQSGVRDNNGGAN